MDAMDLSFTSFFGGITFVITPQTEPSHDLSERDALGHLRKCKQKGLSALSARSMRRFGLSSGTFALPNAFGPQLDDLKLSAGLSHRSDWVGTAF